MTPPNHSNAQTADPGAAHLAVLDGWRGISILLVLATHLLPLGPAEWQLNVTSGILGMAFFFVMSGFLVTRMLLQTPKAGRFLIRRVCRIVPLAWAYLAIIALVAHTGQPQSLERWLAHLLFYANLMPGVLTPLTAHLWSLGVEFQFYVGVGLLVLAGGRSALYVLPFACLLVTGLRVVEGVHVSIQTPFRLDEILCGATLALFIQAPRSMRIVHALQRTLGRLSPWPVLLLLALSSHPASGALNFARPYLAALLVGITLFNRGTWLERPLTSTTLAYIAQISYALYVLHPGLAATWLGSGDIAEKYLKRPLLFLVLFVAAHLSTRYFEQHWIELGKRVGRKPHVSRSAAGAGIAPFVGTPSQEKES